MNNEKWMCNVRGAVCSDKPTDNYYLTPQFPLVRRSVLESFSTLFWKERKKERNSGVLRWPASMRERQLSPLRAEKFGLYPIRWPGKRPQNQSLFCSICWKSKFIKMFAITFDITRLYRGKTSVMSFEYIKIRLLPVKVSEIRKIFYYYYEPPTFRKIILWWSDTFY